MRGTIHNPMELQEVDDNKEVKAGKGRRDRILAELMGKKRDLSISRGHFKYRQVQHWPLGCDLRCATKAFPIHPPPTPTHL